MDFEKNIFINCPFDETFKNDLLKPIIYIVLKNGFNPRLSLEVSDSGQSRLLKITEIIKHCKFSIHDLSKVKSTKANEFARMNMPFELGIDYGLRNSEVKPLGEKHFLILEAKKHDYMKALSDINGLDTKAHKNETKELFKCLYSWFSETLRINKQDPPKKTFDDFMQFNSWLFDEKLNRFQNEIIALDYIQNITIPEYIQEIKDQF
ncbi:hypothetical protein EWU23_11645 [Cytophagaceae bacterium 50C-KIRBA]|uniref:Uncharacterized protein n=1 Tax=Aquirufa beregesia TaxID=2516556 RepID=A0ABX0EX30_9BACT|nr:hypothetical protein [Aquirufa beregesia]NGZ45129.1 hypothetical protein [Aquirufa beregesia]